MALSFVFPPLPAASGFCFGILTAWDQIQVLSHPLTRVCGKAMTPTQTLNLLELLKPVLARQKRVLMPSMRHRVIAYGALERYQGDAVALLQPFALHQGVAVQCVAPALNHCARGAE